MTCTLSTISFCYTKEYYYILYEINVLCLFESALKYFLFLALWKSNGVISIIYIWLSIDTYLVYSKLIFSYETIQLICMCIIKIQQYLTRMEDVQLLSQVLLYSIIMFLKID